MIYILEDDDSIRELLIYALKSAGYESRGFALPSEFRMALREELPRLVLLDVMLPEEDGLSVLKKLRSDPLTVKLPVMVLSAKGTEYDRVLGLDMGADDYMPKPFGMTELISRVKALLRRAEPEKPKDEFSTGVLTLSVPKRLVSVSGIEVTLTMKEFELLRLLLENRGLVLSRAMILERVWGYSFEGESRTVDVHIRTLRQKLGDAGSCIETVRSVGYRIKGDDND